MEDKKILEAKQQCLHYLIESKLKGSENSHNVEVKLNDGDYIVYGMTHVKVKDGKSTAMNSINLYIDIDGKVIAEDTTGQGDKVVKTLLHQFQWMESHNLLE
jgi:hypothetical protein